VQDDCELASSGAATPLAVCTMALRRIEAPVPVGASVGGGASGTSAGPSGRGASTTGDNPDDSGGVLPPEEVRRRRAPAV
jgi:hypothetical protein